MEINHHSTTCTVTLQEIKPSCSSQITVILDFHNSNKFNYKIKTHGQGNTTTTLGQSYSYDRECNTPKITLTFELDSENTINFNVLTAESQQPLPHYVTPGVWTDVKERVLSFILNQESWLGFEMVVAVDVVTMITVVYNFDTVEHNNVESKLPRYIIGCGSDDGEEDDESDDGGGEELLLNGVNGSRGWLMTTMVLVEKSGAKVWIVLLMTLWFMMMFVMALRSFIMNI